MTNDTDAQWPSGLIPLSTLVQAVRAELKEAQEQADGSLPMIVEAVDLEMTVVATREIGAKFGARLWAVLDSGVEGKVAREATHTIKVSLQPHDPTEADGRLRVSDKTTAPPPLPGTPDGDAGSDADR